MKLFFKILQEGTLFRDNSGAVLDAHSTVTFIQTARHRILVDTGLQGDIESILPALTQLRVDSCEIDLVINTHGHPDHTGANVLFKNADIIIHEKELINLNQKLLKPPGGRCIAVTKGESIDEHVAVMETAGHTPGSISVVINGIGSAFSAPEETVVIAGDAIPLKNNFLKRIPPSINKDRDASIHSMGKILSIADWIIPGHDAAIGTKLHCDI